MKRLLLTLIFLSGCLWAVAQTGGLPPGNIKRDSSAQKATERTGIHIRLVVWDFDGFDGDSISLAINGKPLGPKAIRLGMYKPGADNSTFDLDLPDNNANELHITSISAGTLSLTTVGLLISDGTTSQRLYYRLRKGQTMRLRLVSRK